MNRLLVFNPCTDYALAADSDFYTAPAHVIALRRRLALVPVMFADSGDTILLLDNQSEAELQELPYFPLLSRKGVATRTLSDSMTRSEAGEMKELTAVPWGWDRRIKHILRESLPELKGIPDDIALAMTRRLSHRRTTIDFMREMATEGLCNGMELPREIFSADEAVELFREKRNLFFKAPWSSSGRGIMLTDDLEEKHVRPWVSGVISKQGSVMAEKAYVRKLDFATEWYCSDGKVSFLGFSVFNVSRRGKYQSNTEGDQEYLERIIAKAISEDLSGITACQHRAIKKLIAPHYNGPLGIDMLATADGAVNPCVEINLRHTMGIAQLGSYSDIIR